MSYQAVTNLYLDKNGQATADKTGALYLSPGAVISDEEAVRVGLKAAPPMGVKTKPAAKAAPVVATAKENNDGTGA